jgi:hypothetical protein
MKMIYYPFQFSGALNRGGGGCDGVAEFKDLPQQVVEGKVAVYSGAEHLAECLVVLAASPRLQL